ncbi:MAG: response regulator transcription factor [Opitutae bacterium]|nr:response regulator transcription factor [Opitutae bacterium]
MNPKYAQLTGLLIDDEAYFRRFVGGVLKQEGIGAVVEARDGREAIELFSVRRPDFVILDINMPHMDGLEVLKTMRPLAPGLPIIMLTSVADEMVVEECVGQGATFFIRKDVPANELSAELREVLAESLDQPESSP